jgi:hypothetical protein
MRQDCGHFRWGKVKQDRWLSSERRHGSTREPGHAFLSCRPRPVMLPMRAIDELYRPLILQPTCLQRRPRWGRQACTVDPGRWASHQGDRWATPSLSFYNQPVDGGGHDGADKHVDPGQWASHQGDRWATPSLSFYNQPVDGGGRIGADKHVL